MKFLAYMMMVMSAIFLCCGGYELYRAGEAAKWPPRKARITLSQIVHGKDGQYLEVKGVFLDRQVLFTVQRYAYAVVNSPTLYEKYHALYPAGLVTDIYCDPEDDGIVILDNHPSLGDMYGWEASLAAVFVVGLLILVFRKRMPAVKIPTGEIPLSGIAGKAVGSLMGLLFLALGLWIVSMGRAGRTPAQPLAHREIPGFVAMGLLFTWGGIMAIVKTFAAGRLPRWVDRILLSVYIVCLAAPFLLIGLLDSDQISGSASINGIIVSHSKGGIVGAVVFVGVGVLLLVSLPFLLKRMFRKKERL